MPQGCGVTSGLATLLVAKVLENVLLPSTTFFGFDQLPIDSHCSNESIQALPLEVRSGTIRDALLYVKDLKLGSISTYRNKVLFVGFPGIGKSSLYYSLFPLSGRFVFQRSMFADKGYDVMLYGPHVLIFSVGTGKYRRVLLDCSWKLGRSEAKFSITLSHPSLVQTKKETLSARYVSEIGEDSVERLKTADYILESHDLELVFDAKDASLFAQWQEAIQHWVDNSATTGIETSIKMFPQDQKPPMEVCFMDFAGQGEYVLLR
jgi:hypothetical protein